jgi:hypothetical protein
MTTLLLWSRFVLLGMLLMLTVWLLWSAATEVE